MSVSVCKSSQVSWHRHSQEMNVTVFVISLSGNFLRNNLLNLNFLFNCHVPWWSWCTLYWLVCQVRVTTGDSGLCCCVCVMSFKHWLTPSHVLLISFFFNANCNAVVCLCDGKVCVTSFKSYLTPARVVLFSCFDCNAVVCLCGRKVCVTSFKSYFTPARVVLFSCFDCNAAVCLCGRKRSGWRPRATTHCTPSSTCSPSTTKSGLCCCVCVTSFKH